MVLFVILEELTFREFFLREIRKTKSELFSIIIVSVFFSLSHLNTDSGLLPVFIGSLIISRLYLKSNSILNAILLHFLINISNFFIYLLFANFPELNFVY
ncbi:CPBP family intramembrane glutamic endopeptidase [Flavobacterium sp.]|uniref:CPBP family intramembrane glutamic endopeptidase n=1 Tax=Flavobacterium sp. TaxID=239 RepID=UPI0034190BA7